MIRYIPRKSKVQIELLPHITIPDVLVALFGGGILLLIMTSNFPYNYMVAIAWASLVVFLYVPLTDNNKMYYTMILLFKYLAYKKKYSKNGAKGFNEIKKLIPYEKIVDDKYLDYGEYFGMVLQIKPVEFFLLSEDKQDSFISSFGNALTRVNVDQYCQIVKINKAVLFDDYVSSDEKKYENLLKAQKEGEISSKEVKARTRVFQTRVAENLAASEEHSVFEDCYYIVVYDKNKGSLNETIESISDLLLNSSSPIQSSICTGKNLGIFLKANYTKDFNEKEAEGKDPESLVEWSMPDKVVFKSGYTIVDDKEYRTFNLTDYPLSVGNGWAHSIFAMPSTKVVVNIQPVMRFEAEKQIDKAILEMETKTFYSARTSKQIENETHLSTLRQLLIDIKNSNENLFNVNFHITCENYMKKEMRALLKQNGFKYSEMFGRQVDSFVSSNISKLDTVKSNMRGINTSALAGMFPFISSAMSDEGGFYIGWNDYGKVFINFFRRDSERVNSNMMIIGKSGAGKSFAVKDLLANMAGDNTKIFVLDPEYEYATLCYNLAGKVIDVGTGLQGRINPFHITPSLQVEGVETQLDDYSSHLKFLEEFFKVVLTGISSDAFEKINSLVVDMYAAKGIDNNTDLTKLKAKDFPIFDDLYKLILSRLNKEKDEYIKRIYQTMEIYIRKFATGGRNANLWNGPTTLETREHFVVFSFRSLLANANKVLANAQMLLILRYLNNEVINNKDYNRMMGYGEADPDRRKVIIAIDEAHVFIDKDYPIALNFMEDLAKRIRKYDGMQIVITQNIKDFVGSEEIQKQSTAIINASQFTMVLSLAPNDMTDLVSLYRNAGGINEEEQQTIVQAKRGEAFFITSPNARTFLKIQAFDRIIDMFSKRLDIQDDKTDNTNE